MAISCHTLDGNRIDLASRNRLIAFGSRHDCIVAGGEELCVSSLTECELETVEGGYRYRLPHHRYSRFVEIREVPEGSIEYVRRT